MSKHSMFLLLAISVSSLVLSGCSTLGLGGVKRNDVAIQKVSEGKGHIRSVHVHDSPTGTTIFGSVDRRTRFRYISGHVHFDLYNKTGERLESGKATYRIRTKNRSLNKIARFSGTLESSMPQQARLVVTHHTSHDKSETLDERLGTSSDGRLSIE